MKRRGIINSALNARLSLLGHGDLVVVADCGLPVPDGVPVIDLAVVHGLPGFEPVVDALLEELVFESALMAEEGRATPVEDFLGKRFPCLALVPHADFKQATSLARLLIRTGEATPYANVLLRCGVPF